MSVGLSGEDTATLGIDALRGIQVAQEEQPDLQFGETVFPLQLDTQDTACGTEGGAATAEYFTADARVVGVLGPVCTAACLAAAPIYDAAGYSLVSPGCTSSVIQQRGFASFNRTASSDYVQGANTTYYVLTTLRIDRAALAAALRSYGPVAGLSGPSRAMAAANVPPPPSASGRYRMAPSRSSRRWLTPTWLSNECNSSPLRYTEHKRSIQTAGHLPRQGGNHEMDA